MFSNRRHYIILYRDKISVKFRLTHFMPLVAFYIPWKHKKVFWFSNVFKGYTKRPVEGNGLIKVVFPMSFLGLSVILESFNQHWKNSEKENSVFDILTILTHMEELVLYWIQYTNSLKYKVGCFWCFSWFTQSIKFFEFHYRTDVWKAWFIKQTVKMNGSSFSNF